MATYNDKAHNDNQHNGAVLDINHNNSSNQGNGSKGSSIHTDDVKRSLKDISGGTNEHDHPIVADSSKLPTTGDRNYNTVLGGGKRVLKGDGKQDSFLFASAGKVTFDKVEGSGKTEFPFPNGSPGSASLDLKLSKDGSNLKVNGEFKDFIGKPLFQDGKLDLDPKANLLGGKKAEELVEGFKKTPFDSEGNALTGGHFHVGPTGDDRGPHADGTIERNLKVTQKTASSGTLTGDFNLTPVETAFVVAGNNYFNIHSDGPGGLPTGEARADVNKNRVHIKA